MVRIPSVCLVTLPHSNPDRKGSCLLSIRQPIPLPSSRSIRVFPDSASLRSILTS
jgi:hypothetical protein